MSAGFATRPIAGSKAPFAPQALVVFLGMVLIVGAIIGAAFVLTRSANQRASDAALVSQALLQIREDERASEVAVSASAVSQALIKIRADERASQSAVIAGAVSQALIKIRADERASWTVGSSPTSTRPMSEQESLRREHVQGNVGTAGPVYSGRIRD